MVIWTHLLLRILFNTGARVSEIIGVTLPDMVLDGAACVHLHGKGRKQRAVPLWRSTIKQIRAWLRINPQLQPTSALLPNRDGKAMTRGNVTQRLALAVKAATVAQPQLAKHRISPHIIRHTTAMHLLQSGVDISVIALWLGHESPTTTHQYDQALQGTRLVDRVPENPVVMRRPQTSLTDSVIVRCRGPYRNCA